MSTGQRAYRYDNPSGADINAVSPGFTWGKSGTIPKGAYLLNDTVPSNVAGRIVPVYDGIISEAFISIQNTSTVSFDIQKRVGSVFTTVLTITITAARVDVQSFSTSVSRLDELVCRVSPTSANKPQNPVIGLIIKGDTA